MNLFANIDCDNVNQNRFGNFSQDQLIESFIHEWDEMSDEDKLQIIQETGNRYAKEKGIVDPPFFVREDNPYIYGGYKKDMNLISINIDACDNPFEALDTIAHEENHSYQKQCVEKNEGYSKGALTVFRCELNSDIYENSGDKYLRQSMEVDSNNAGLNYVLRFADKETENPDFLTYIDNRKAFYMNINKDYEEHRDQAVISEYDQMQKAQENGYVSENEMSGVRVFLLDKDNEIRRETERLENKIDQIKECVRDDGLTELVENKVISIRDNINQVNKDDGLSDVLSAAKRTENVFENRHVINDMEQ